MIKPPHRGIFSLGSWLQIPSPDVAEILACQFDWIVIDLEHGAIDRRDLTDLARSVESRGSMPLARVMEANPSLVRQALDAGCYGAVLPHVESASEFTALASQVTWPPEGTRSIGFFRANGFGREFHQYAERLKRPYLVPMIESLGGLSAMEDIAMSGLADALLIGPYDLSAALGEVGAFDSPGFTEAEERLLRVCNKHAISAGIHIVEPTPESLRRRIDQGYKLIASGMDSVFLRQGAEAAGTQ